MTTYTSLGLPILESTDKIAASGDGLREDLNALATLTNTAIGNEGVRAEGAAKSYADTKDTSNRAAWAAADTAKLAEAKAYADAQDVTNLNAAKAYADGALWFKGYLPNGTDLNTYTPNGRWAVRLTDDVATMTNTPPGAGPGFVEFTTSAHGMKVQTWVNYVSNTAWRRTTASVALGTFTPWGSVDVDAVNTSKTYTDSLLGPVNLVVNGYFRDGLTGWTNTGAWVVQTSANGVTSWARTMSGADGAFAQSIVVPTRFLSATLRLKVLAMTTSTGTLITTITTTAGATTLNHPLTTSYVEKTLDVAIPAGQGSTPITLNVGRFTGTVYMTAIRLEAL